MTITADAILTYILIAIGGFLVKVILDWIKDYFEKKTDNARRYEEQNWRVEITKIVRVENEQLVKELKQEIEGLKETGRKNYDYWQKMYWDAVDRLEKVQVKFENLEKQDIIFYRNLLIDTCKEYIAKGELTEYQFDRLTEWYKIYKELGGNHQGDLYYKKAVALPIIKDKHMEEDDRMHSIFDYEDLVESDTKK